MEGYPLLSNVEISATVLQQHAKRARCLSRNVEATYQASGFDIPRKSSGIILQLYTSLSCCFLLLLSDVATGNFLTRLDRDVFHAIYEGPTKRQTINSVMEKITVLGDAKTIMGLSVFFMAYGGDSELETGRLLSSAYVGSGLIVYGLKEFIRRKRPLEEELGNPSFPSGHTAFAFTSATILGSEYHRWRVPFYIAAGLVGLSRIYLGRHYPSDVLMGAVLGTITGTVILKNRFTLLSWKF